MYSLAFSFAYLLDVFNKCREEKAQGAMQTNGQERWSFMRRVL